jgi:uncharacterized RDD family membrane protein YckC
VSRHPWERLLAWLVDWVCVLGWVVVTAAVGVPLYFSGATSRLSVVALNVIAAVVMVVPVTFALAALESSAREGSIGKRFRRLAVVNSHTGGRVSFGRALLRNSVKIAIPWLLGHAAVFEIVSSSESGSLPPSIWILTAIAYVLPVVFLVSKLTATPAARSCRMRVVYSSTASIGQSRELEIRISDCAADIASCRDSTVSVQSSLTTGSEVSHRTALDDMSLSSSS